MKQILPRCTFLLLVFVACKKDDPVNTGYLQTSVYFIANKDTIRYSDSSRNMIVAYNATGRKSYAITLGSAFRGISYNDEPVLFAGQEIKLPYFRYYGPYGDHGTETLNDDIAPGSGSTVVLRLTRVGESNFDATFSGKVWSAKEADTLFIKEGVLKQVKLPG
jgi:hypothetical protein